MKSGNLEASVKSSPGWRSIRMPKTTPSRFILRNATNNLSKEKDIRSHKAQISMELMVIVGVILILFIPLLLTIYLEANKANDKISSYQSVIALSRLAGTVNSVGELGKDAFIITDIYVPSDVEKIEFINSKSGLGGEIVLHVSQGDISNDLVEVVKFHTSAPDISDPYEGIYRFKVINMGDVEDQVRLELMK